MTHQPKNQQKICLPATDLPRVVVIGAGFAGMTFIKKLKNSPVQIVLVDKNNFHQFQPLLYQIAISGLDPDSVNFPIRKLFGSHKNFIYRYANVNRIVWNQNKLETDRGDISYDYLVIATGTDADYFGMEEIRTHSISLQTIHDALSIRNRILENLEKAVSTCDHAERESLTNFVLVGGGPTGVELAGALAEFKRYILRKDYSEIKTEMMNIYLLEMKPRLLPGFSGYASKKASSALRRLGVNVMTGTKVNHYDGNTLVTAKQEKLNARTLIWAAGVQGNVPAGLETIFITGGRIQVDAYHKIKGMDNVFAIGDIAAMINDEHPKGHPMVATVAIQQGKSLGKQFLKMINQSNNCKPFRYKNKGMLATIGKARAVADIKRFKLSGFIAWLIWATVHLYYLAGIKNKMVTAISWIYHYLTYDKANRLILSGFEKSKSLQ